MPAHARPSRTSSPSTLALAVGLAALAGCGDNLAGPVDAPPIDTPAPADAAPDGPCGSGLYVTGELVDIDSSTALFNGADGVFTLRGVSGVGDTTSPNGRFELCAPAQTSYVFDVSVTGAGPMPRADGVDGIAYIEPEALTPGNEVIDFRAFTPARLTSFLATHGVTIAASRAHVIVDMTGDLGNLTLDRNHAAVISGTDAAVAGTFVWATGQAATARYVMFANVDVSAGTATIGGDQTGGTHLVPVEAGKLTYVALSW